MAPDDPFLSGGSIDADVDEAIAAIEPRAPVLYAPPPSTGAAGADRPATVPGPSGAAQRVASAPPSSADSRPTRRSPPVAGLTKVIGGRARPRRGRARWVLSALAVLAVVAVLGVGGFHLRRSLTRPAAEEIPALPGAPDGLALVVQGEKRLLVALPGSEIDPTQLDAFRAKQSAAGIEVRELAPGTWILEPASPSRAVSP